MRPLTRAERRLLEMARTAVLATTDPAGRARLVPICYVARDAPAGVAGTVLYSPLDAKPKRVSDPHRLARVRDIVARPEVGLLVDRWDEDWTRLAWIRLRGRAELLEPDVDDFRAERQAAIAALWAKYPQYVDHDLETRPLIRVTLTEATSWGNLDADGAGEPA
jgi:PPOX class probable F420-dependent enzyme